MSKRFFSDQPIPTDAVGRSVELAGAEAHHLIHVMRAKTGQTVELFDGSGSEFTAEINRVGRSQVELLITAQRKVDREPPVALTLAVALPKGDRQRWLVEKATELGVSRLVPIVTTRGVAQPLERALDRLRQSVIEASKQCGRNRLMEIAPAVSWKDLVAQSASLQHRLFANAGGQVDWRDGIRESEQLIAAVGPEGGWTDEEAAMAIKNGWRAIDLGPRILRVETAAILIAGRVTHPA
jgi:16S rRNA (uracil1498-N3)-methyltransferase